MTPEQLAREILNELVIIRGTLERMAGDLERLSERRRQPSLVEVNSVPKPGSLNDQVKRAWPTLVAAAASYGRGWTKLSDTRMKLIRARLSESDLPSLEAAIHGAARSLGDDVRHRYMVPETIYRPSKYLKYVEAAKQGGAVDEKAAARNRVDAVLGGSDE